MSKYRIVKNGYNDFFIEYFVSNIFTSNSEVGDWMRIGNAFRTLEAAKQRIAEKKEELILEKEEVVYEL